MDGADSSTMTQSSTYISAWTSKGTNALSFTQATSTKQPQFVSNVYNGNSVVRCINPGNNVVNVNIASVNNALLQTGASFCIFIVHNPTIANGCPFFFQNGGGSRIGACTTENGNVIFDTPNIRLTYAAPGNYLTSGLKLDVFWSVANAINYRAFGSATASASAAASTWTDGTLTFGSFAPTQADYYYQTDIGEIIWFNTALTLTQVQQVESYMAQKWGLTSSLAAGHPGLTTTVYRPDYIKNSVIIRNVVKPITYFSQFSPRQISGLGLWLDAADSSTVTGTSPITAWTDKSGTGRTVTITSGPTYGTTFQAGNRTLSFNNNTITTSIASAVGTGDFTLVAVWYQSAAGTNTVLSLGTVASSSQSLGFSGNKYNFYQFGDVNESAYSTATPSWVVQIGTRIGSVKKVYINGNVGTTPSSTSYDASVTTVTIGKGDNFAISGEVGEILIYTGTMSDTSRQLLESYLAQKWGLTASLPGGHSHFTQRTGAITTVTNTKFRMTGIPRISSISFSPTSIAGLQMWMDAADSSSDSMTLSGSTVTVWKDKSGLGNHTTARSGTSTLTSNAINGKSAISMAGGYFTGPFATANTGTQVHAFAVLTIDSSTGQWARPFALGRPGVNDYSESTTTFAIIRYNGTQAVGIGRAGQYLSVGIPAYSSPFLVQSSHNGATEYMSVNGNLTVSSAGTGQSGNFNITSYGLGVNTNTGDYFALNGYYGEVMYFNVQLSDANRQKIEGYLAWKWGLQALLPGGHPHASAAP